VKLSVRALRINGVTKNVLERGMVENQEKVIKAAYKIIERNVTILKGVNVVKMRHLHSVQ